MGWLARTISKLSKRGRRRLYDDANWNILDESDTMISIDVVRANNGFIVRAYHTSKDDYGDNDQCESLHIVSEYDDLKECVNKIITFEILKKT